MLWASKKLIIATKNQGKLKEFKQCFHKLGIEVLSLLDVQDCPEIIEDGATFAANAMKKARVIADHLHILVLADDSGLCVDALDGRPGVYSARYAGNQATDQMNNHKLLSDLQFVRTTGGRSLLSPARFVCALVLYDPVEGRAIEVEGTCPGYITATPQGKNGFGYDPLFFLPQFGKTMAEITSEQKNQISHRGEAIRKLLSVLDKT